MDIYAQLVAKIIEQQETIIGPVAIQQAELVEGLSLNWKERVVLITGDKKSVVNELIKQYKKLFGQIAVEVSKEAAASITVKLNTEEMPNLLK